MVVLMSDLLPTNRPALNSTDDMPVASVPAPSAEVKATAVEAKPQTAEAKPAAEPKAEPVAAPEVEAPEFDLDQVRRDAAVIEAATRASENDKKPNRSAFKSQDDFDTALIDWSTRSAMRSAQAAAAKERLSAGERQRTESIARSFHQRTEKFVNEKADFREVVLNPHLPISEAMAAALVSEPNRSCGGVSFGQESEGSRPHRTLAAGAPTGRDRQARGETLSDTRRDTQAARYSETYCSGPEI